jgi:hypothetical protein
MWNFFLYAVTAIQAVFFIGNTVFSFTKCHPIEANWILSFDTTHCVDPSVMRTVSNLGSAINIATDFLLSLAPMVMLWNLRRPLRERILVCLLTGMGLLASLASVVKAVHVASWGLDTVDVWALAISIATWTVVEEFLAVFAACSPSLKKPLQRLLGSIGVLLTGYETHISFIDRRKFAGDDHAEKDLEQPSPAYFPGGDAANKPPAPTESSSPDASFATVTKGNVHDAK